MCRCVEVAGRDGEDRPGAGADRARPRRCVLEPGERRGRRRQPPRRRLAGARRRAATRVGRAVATRPGPASRAARCAPRCRSSSAASARRRAASRRAAPTAAASVSTRTSVRPGARTSSASASGRPRSSSRLSRTTRPSCELDLAVEPGGDVVVVRRDDEREAELGLQRLDQVEHALAGVRVEVARRLVAQQQLRLAARARARSRPAAPRRPTARPAGGRPSPPSPTSSSSVAGSAAGSPPRARCAAKATFSNAVKCGRRFAPWNTYAMPCARTAPRAARSSDESGRPCHSTLAGSRLDQAAEDVQQRRLPRARATEQREAVPGRGSRASTPSSACTAASPAP